METNLKKKLSAAEYEKFPEGPAQQLIDGEILMSPSPTPLHQLIVGEIYSLVKDFAIKNKSGTVLFSPVDVRFTEVDVFQPDIILISRERKNLIGEIINGAPDVVIEVLSPSSAYQDLTHKKNIYEETGVKEFWVVDPEGKTLEIYENRNKTFILFSKARASGKANSKILMGLRIEIDKLFAVLSENIQHNSFSKPN